MGLNVAIVGLGRVGSEFLAELLSRKTSSITIRGAAELNETPGKQAARDAGIALMPLDELVALGKEIDIIFDLSGSRTVRTELRAQMEKNSNTHSVVVPETVSRLVWSLMTDKALPDVHGNMGY